MRTFIALDRRPTSLTTRPRSPRRLSASMEALPEARHLPSRSPSSATPTKRSRCRDRRAGSRLRRRVPVLAAQRRPGKFGRATDATLWLGIAAAPELEQLAARLRDELRARDVP
ncbi:MAG: hypothetical protein ACLSVD_15400 [Eggerthellaceae bacterium]